MRVAALYDVHGNVHALEAVLADVADEAVDAVVVGGDIVLGPFPAETLARLREVEHAHWLRGNCERALVDSAGVPPEEDELVRWCVDKLGSREVEKLVALPTEVVLEVDGLGRVLFSHATPRSDIARITRATPDAMVRELLDDVAADVVVCGHTHIQFDRHLDAIRVVNPGSVGWPWEDERGAYWALLGPDVEPRRTEYDVDAAVAAIRASGAPDDGYTESMLVPRGAEQMTRRLEETR